jgi:hypothetical protein
MKKNSSIALSLTLAIALTTGTVLVKRPSTTDDKARGGLRGTCEAFSG